MKSFINRNVFVEVPWARDLPCHVTVRGDDMITLPKAIIDLLEYACIGVHGKVSRTLLSRLMRCVPAEAPHTVFLFVFSM